MESLSANFWIVFDLAVLIYWIGVVVYLIAEDREPTKTLAWLLVLFALPFVGLVLYFFLGRNWPRIVQDSAGTRALQGILARFMPTVYAPHVEVTQQFLDRIGHRSEARVAALIQQKAGAPPLPVRTCDLYADGDEYFDVLIADLASARRFIHMNYFIWKADELSARIAEVLLDRLAAGVEVRILNDYVGSLLYSKGDFDTLRDAGAHVGSDVKGLRMLNYSNHRKIAVIDAEIGHTGGFNIGQEYIDGGKRFPAWRDTGIRITGSGVADLEKLFDMRWYEVYSENLFEARYYPDPAVPAGEIMVQTVHHGYDDRWKAASRAYQMAIAGASDRIMLQSPYFVPDQTMLDVIINAAAGGVRIDFMTLAPSRLDKKLPYWAAESYFEPLLAAGVRIWLWEKGFFHAKSLTVDGRACAVGSLNMDIRSLQINKELMLWVYDEAVATRSEQIFLNDMLDCRELTLDEVREWPRSRRTRNSAARLMSQLL